MSADRSDGAVADGGCAAHGAAHDRDRSGIGLGLLALLARAAALDAPGPSAARSRPASSRSRCGIAAVPRGERKLGLVGDRARHCRHARRGLAAGRRTRTTARRASSPPGLLAVDAPLRDAARVRGDGRHLLRALRRREHRPRGDDADRAPSSASGARSGAARGSSGSLTAMVFGGLLALIHAFFCIHLRADQIVSGFAINFLALGLTGYLFSSHLRPDGIAADISRSRTSPRLPRRHPVPRRRLRQPQPDGLDHVRRSSILSYVVLFKTPIGLRHPLGRRAPAGGGHGRHLGLRRPLRGRRPLGHARRARRRVPLGRLRRHLRREHERGPRLHRARRRHLRQVAARFGPSRPRLLFGFGFALAIPLQREADISANLISTLPYVLTLVALVGLIGRSVAAGRGRAAVHQAVVRERARRAGALPAAFSALGVLVAGGSGGARARATSGSDRGGRRAPGRARPRPSSRSRSPAGARGEHQRSLGRVGGRRLAAAARRARALALAPGPDRRARARGLRRPRLSADATESKP